jgi:hypothetical protein
MNAQHTERGQRPSALGAERDVYNLVTTFFRFLVSAICFTTLSGRQIAHLRARQTHDFGAALRMSSCSLRADRQVEN